MAEKKSQEEQVGVVQEPQAQQQVAPPAPPIEAAKPEAEPGERPDWLPENFKTPEDLVASYRESQDKIRQEGEARRAQDEQIQGLTQQMQQLLELQQQSPRGAGDPLEEWAVEIEAARDAGDVRRELELTTQLQQYVVQSTLATAQQQAQQQNGPQLEEQAMAQHATAAFYVDQQLRSRHPDENWDAQDDTSMGARIAAKLEAEPDWLPPQVAANPLQALTALERVFQIVKAEELLGQAEQLRQAGVSQEDIDRQRKLSAGVVPGASGRPGQPSEVDQQLAEMQASLRGSSWGALRGATPAR